jgi:hypothetical protein
VRKLPGSYLFIISSLALRLIDARWLQHIQASRLPYHEEEGGRRKTEQHLFRKVKVVPETSIMQLQVNVLQICLFSSYFFLPP